MEDVHKSLNNLTRYAISYFKELKKRYGGGRERKTEMTEFSKVLAKDVIVANQNLYLNRKEGFVGYGGSLRKEENIGKCSTMDDIIAFTREGTMQVSRVAEKLFVGKNPVHVALFSKEEPITYCLLYRDGKAGNVFAKKFQVSGVTRDKSYSLTKGTSGSRVLFFAALEEGQKDPIIQIHLAEDSGARKREIEFDFATIAVKGRAVLGNIVTKYKVAKVNKC